MKVKSYLSNCKKPLLKPELQELEKKCISADCPWWSSEFRLQYGQNQVALRPYWICRASRNTGAGKKSVKKCRCEFHDHKTNNTNFTKSLFVWVNSRKTESRQWACLHHKAQCFPEYRQLCDYVANRSDPCNQPVGKHHFPWLFFCTVPRFFQLTLSIFRTFATSSNFCKCPYANLQLWRQEGCQPPVTYAYMVFYYCNFFLLDINQNLSI